jgi:uncharacterized protein with FMN-binding domain
LRKTATIVLTTAALVVPVANGAAALKNASTKATAKKRVVTKKLQGDSFQADRWGTVKIYVVLRTTTVGGKKVTRKYVDLGGSYTYHTDRSQFIMSQSLPQLRQEFLQVQSANVQMISGATYTSQAFQQSLQSALAKA